MEMIRVRGVLFDLDGVLIDSTPAVERVWRGWALERGFEPEDVIRQAHGRPSVSTIRELLPNGDIAAENAEVERREIEDVEGVVPLPGVLDVLRELPEDKWAIVTSCTRALAEVRIAAAGLPRPTVIVTSTDIKRGKPHGEPYEKGAEMLGVPAEECVVFEDAPAGIVAGKAAGARVIGLTTTMKTEELQDANPDWIVSSWADLEVEREGALVVVKKRNPANLVIN